MDLNQGPQPYQGCAHNQLSYGPIIQRVSDSNGWTGSSPVANFQDWFIKPDSDNPLLYLFLREPDRIRTGETSLLQRPGLNHLPTDSMARTGYAPVIADFQSGVFLIRLPSHFTVPAGLEPATLRLTAESSNL